MAEEIKDRSGGSNRRGIGVTVKLAAAIVVSVIIAVAALTDGSLYHATFVPEPEYNALLKSWYINGLASEDFILGDVYFDEDRRSYVVGASGVLKTKSGVVRGVAADISHGIEQIAVVVESNVNTAESSAAASEQLTSQAAALREIVSRFRLKR